MRKAQMEMLGLVIIVFLMALGMFFMLQVSTEQSKKAQSVSPQNVNLAQNTIDAIKYLKVDCPPNRKVGLDELIQDLAYQNRIDCDWTPSDEYARGIISTILNRTLVNWSKSFVFRIRTGGDDMIEPVRTYYNETLKKVSLEPIGAEDCNDEADSGDQGFQALPLPSNAGTVVITIFICT